jgi:hypothetical protein
MTNYYMKQVEKIIILLLSFVIFSCSESTKKNGVVVSGKIQNASGQKLIFRELDLDSFHNLDSMKLDDIGFFRFIFNPTEEGFYILKFEKDEYILLLLEKGEEVHVEADLQKQPFSYTVTGSPGSAILREFYIQTIQNLLKADSLRNVLLQQRESPDFYQLSLSFDTLFIKIIENQKQIQKNFIKQNPGSLASLMVLNYKFGVVPVVNMKDDFPVYQNLDSMLSKKYPLNKHVVFHHQRVVEHELQEKEKQTQKK